MKNNFDLKKFLVENKLTNNSRQVVNENKDHDEEILAYIAETYIQNAKDGDSNYAGFLDLNIRDAVQDVVGILQDPKHPLHRETKKEYQIVSRDKARGLFEKKGKLKEDFSPSPNSDIPDANAEDFDVATAFKKARVDMSKPVAVTYHYGYAQYSGLDTDIMSAEAAIKKLEAERQENQKNYTDDGLEVPSDRHGYEFENYSVLEEDMPEGHEYKLSYYLDGDYTYSVTQEKSGVSENKGKLNEEGIEEADYPMEEAFKRYGIDMSKDVIVAEMDGGTAGLGGGQLDVGEPEPAAVVAKRFEKHRLATIAEYEAEKAKYSSEFPVQYEDGFYGDYTPKGTEHKLTYSEFDGTMWDIFQAPSGVSEKKVNEEDSLEAFSDTIQVVGYPKTVEDALKVIERYERDRDPVSREEAKDLVAGMRATDDDDFDRNITNLIVKAFNIKLKR